MSNGPVGGGLPDAEYVSLTTYRRSGDPVATPVWAARDAERLVVLTRTDSGKVKRLRHTSRVTVAPCTARGVLTGAPVPAEAGIVDDSGRPAALAALRRRYRLRFAAVYWPSHLWGRLTARHRRRHELLWITPAG